MIKSGISQTGGKFRLMKEIIPYLIDCDYFMSLFSGACWIELNKPRSKYELLNDKDPQYINYHLVLQKYPNELNKMREGVFGLLSEYLFDLIASGKLQASNPIEYAYFFYYLNKAGFGGSSSSLLDQHFDLDLKELLSIIYKQAYLNALNIRFEQILPEQNETINVFDLIKKTYLMGFNAGFNDYYLDEKLKDVKIKDLKKIIKTNNPESLKMKSSFIYEKPLRLVEEANKKKITSNYRGITLPTVTKKESTEKSKSWFRGITSKVSLDSFSKTKMNYKGINAKTTRPYQNNDCGLLTPIDPQCILRSQYCNYSARDFRKAYKQFHKAFHLKKGLTKECLIYSDPPYPEDESMNSYYYIYSFLKQDHLDLIDIMLESPFNIITSIGGTCDYYIDVFKKEPKWYIIDLEVTYCQNANTQKKSKEYLILNYDPAKIPKRKLPKIQDQLKNQSILDFTKQSKVNKKNET